MAENAFLLASMPSCEPVQKHRTSTKHLAEVGGGDAVHLGGFGLGCVFLGSGCCIGVVFWFVLCSILWVLKLLQLCEVV